MKNTIKLIDRYNLPSGVPCALALGMSLLVAPLGFAQDDAEDEIFELSPFTVEGADDEGYRATSTLAGTRIRTDLKDVGSAISVMTQEFLRDTNSNNAEDLLVYAPSTEVAGQGGNFIGQGDGAVLDTTNRTAPVSNSRVRGLAEADNTRNFYLSDIPWDSYNVSRIDLQRGPNAILFGIGSPAGIVNAGLSSAAFEDSNEASIQFGSFDSMRLSGNFNKVLIEDQLAVRFAFLKDETKYRQDPAFRDDDRVYGAFTWKPEALSSESYNTEFSFNYEKGEINSNNPRLTPPHDAITPWFDALGKATYSGTDSASQDSDWLGAPGSRVWDGVVTSFDPAQGDSYVTQVFPWPDRSAGIVGADGGNIVGIQLFNNYASNASLEGSDISAYKSKSLTDASIFDFYNHLIEGPNKSEFNDFDAMNFSFRQNLFNNKLGYELAWDQQDADWGYRNFLSGDAAVVTVDVMETLLDGSANPNVGRPFTIAGGGSAGGYTQSRQRDVFRATVYGELDFQESSSSDRVGSILGKHTFTGLFSTNKIDSTTRNWSRYYIGDSYEPNNQNAVGQASRDAIIYSYLGGDIRGASSASGLNLNGIKTLQVQESSTVNAWNNESAAWQRIPLEIVNADSFNATNRPYRNGSLTGNKIKSKALVWQGKMFDGLLVPMIGWREDEDTARAAGGVPTRDAATYAGATSGGIVNVFHPDWRLPVSGDPSEIDYDNDGSNERLFNSEAGSSLTKSVVFHLPQSFTDSTGLGVSLHYSESSNFQPDASRIDVLGNSVASPNGETKDYGITFTAMNEKLIVKVNKYDTKVFNSTAGGSIGGNYLIGANEAWGQRAAIQARDNTGSFATVFGTSTSGGTLVYRPDRVLEDGETYTQAEIDATYAVQEAAINAWLADPVPAQFQTTWALGDYANGAGVTNFGPPGLVVTADTLAEGTEIELIANPTPNFTIAWNSSKTSAQRQNLAAGYLDWVNSRWDDYTNTPQGDVRLWGPDPDGDGGETAEGKYQRETIAGLAFWKALLGSDVPELAKWRHNAVANYSFTDGRFDGLNIGGSMRTQDAPTTGFPVINGPDGLTYDVNNPIKGKRETTYDFWVGYGRPINDNIDWKVQLNIRNAFGGKDLYPVTSQPDGSPGTYRIGAPTTWTLRNTFTF